MKSPTRNTAVQDLTLYTDPVRHNTLCLKKGTPTLSTVTLERINRFQRFLAPIFTTQLAIKWLFNFPSHPTSAFTLPGRAEQTKYALK